ncbi:MAG: SGNH/GDSL hydrolase family protein [Egibacteraceae bacterium]
MTRRGRLTLGLAVGVPAATVALLAAQVYYAATVDRPDLEPTYEMRARVEVPGDARALRLVVIGDSLAAGTGAPTVAGALPTQIAERVAAELDRSVAVRGHAVSGARTADVFDTQVPLIAESEPDAVVIVVGSNDVTHATPPWTLRSRTDDLLEATRAAAPGTPIVLAGIPLFGGADRLPLPLRWVVMAYARPLRSAQAEVVRETHGVAYVDIAGDASPRFRGVPDAMSADGYHPSPVGYAFWADAIAPAVVDAVDPTT